VRVADRTKASGLVSSGTGLFSDQEGSGGGSLTARRPLGRCPLQGALAYFLVAG